MKNEMQKQIAIAIQQLLDIVQGLHELYPSKEFTLDGRLVGDLGEVIAEIEYDIKLHENLQKHYDAISSDGRSVQIKATMKQQLSFPCDFTPDY